MSRTSGCWRVRCNPLEPPAALVPQEAAERPGIIVLKIGKKGDATLWVNTRVYLYLRPCLLGRLTEENGRRWTSQHKIYTVSVSSQPSVVLPPNQQKPNAGRDRWCNLQERGGSCLPSLVVTYMQRGRSVGESEREMERNFKNVTHSKLQQLGDGNSTQQYTVVVVVIVMG